MGRSDVQRPGTPPLFCTEVKAREGVLGPPTPVRSRRAPGMRGREERPAARAPVLESQGPRAEREEVWPLESPAQPPPEGGC